MAVQTVYSINHGEAYAGMKADQQLNNTVSTLNKGLVNIPFGKGIVSDGSDGGRLPDAASVAIDFMGVSMRELNRAIADGAALGAIPNRDFTVISFGAVWVVAATSVVKDDPVFLRVGSTNVGDFSNIAGSGVTLSIPLVNAKFLNAGAIGELVKISIGVGG